MVGSSRVKSARARCSGEMKLQPMFRENSTATSNTRLQLPEKGMSISSPEPDGDGAPGVKSLAPMPRHSSRARSMLIPDERNPPADRSSAMSPSSRWRGATAPSPSPLASRCDSTTAFTARSVNRSNTALTTTPPRRRGAGAASRAADARIGRPAATATALPPPPAPAGENRRRRPAPVARMDADGTDDDEQQHASIALPRAAKLAPNSPHGV